MFFLFLAVKTFYCVLEFFSMIVFLLPFSLVSLAYIPLSEADVVVGDFSQPRSCSEIAIFEYISYFGVARFSSVRFSIESLMFLDLIFLGPSLSLNNF